jgi:hypothetical protein
MTDVAPSLLELVADRLRRRLLATLVAAVGDAAGAAPKMVRAGAGPQHVMLQARLEDFAAHHGFLEFHDFDELLPDVLAVSTVDIFIGEASAAPLLRPGDLDMRQRVEACISELVLVAQQSWFDKAMLAVCVDTQHAAEQWLMDLTQLSVAAALVIGSPFSVTEQAQGAWVAAGVVTSRRHAARGSAKNGDTSRSTKS